MPDSAHRLLYGRRDGGSGPKPIKPTPDQLMRALQADPGHFVTPPRAGRDPFTDKRLGHCQLLYCAPSFIIRPGSDCWPEELWGQESPDALYLDTISGQIVVAVSLSWQPDQVLIDAFDDLDQALDYLNDQRQGWDEDELIVPVNPFLTKQDIYQALGFVD